MSNCSEVSRRETKFWPTSNSWLEVISNMRVMRVYMSWIMLDPF